jgi:lipoate-protein ligase B
MTNTICRWLCCDLSTLDYEQGLDLQRRIAAAKGGGGFSDDVLLVVEHPPVFTLGRRGGLENLCVAPAFLASRRIPVVQVERGGNITYHGPGQLVVYPIVALSRRRLSVMQFVDRLEEVMLRIAADWGIRAGRDERNRGVWVGNDKLGSIGINIRRGVTFHGLALNVCNDLSPFSWIHPCGLEGVSMTSMEQQAGRPIPMDGVREAAVRHVAGVFGQALIPVSRDFLETVLADGTGGQG